LTIKRHLSAGGGSSKRQQPHRPSLASDDLLRSADQLRWPAL